MYPAGTPIPIASLNPFAAAVLNALPAPNTGSATSISNNYQTLLLFRDYSDKYDAKLDGQINDRMSYVPALEPAQRYLISSSRACPDLRAETATALFMPSNKTPRSATTGP